jgi:hypothetical protein
LTALCLNNQRSIILRPQALLYELFGIAEARFKQPRLGLQQRPEKQALDVRDLADAHSVAGSDIEIRLSRR